MTESLTNASVLITGGTGSFGTAFINRLLDTNVKKITIFSRDEKKQDDMRTKYSDARLAYFIGDVRDPRSLDRIVPGHDYVFHAAALKQVPSNEFFPLEAVKTNILGTENIVNACVNSSVKSLVVLSTDKAVYPINAMGISKAMAEKVAIAEARRISSISSDFRITITRYGNVLGSRGSVIPLFINKIRRNQKLLITNPSMTRFLLPLESAIDLVIYALINGQNADILVRKSPSCTIETLALALMNILGHNVDTVNVGPRHSEKFHETLVSKEEMNVAHDLGDYYRIPADTRSLNYDTFYKPSSSFEKSEYTSSNTNVLNLADTISLLTASSHVRLLLDSENVSF